MQIYTVGAESKKRRTSSWMLNLEVESTIVTLLQRTTLQNSVSFFYVLNAFFSLDPPGERDT